METSENKSENKSDEKSYIKRDDKSDDKSDDNEDFTISSSNGGGEIEFLHLVDQIFLRFITDCTSKLLFCSSY